MASYASKIRTLKRRLVVGGIIIGVLGALFFAIDMYHESMTATLKKVETEQHTLIREIGQSEKKVEKLKEAIALYRDLPQDMAPVSASGSSDATRIRIARPILLQLRERYKIASLDVKFEPFRAPMPANATNNRSRNNSYNNPNSAEEEEFYEIGTYKIQLSMVAATDEIIYSALKDAMNEIPGHVQIMETSLTLDSKSKSSLPRISAQATLLWSLIEGDPVDINLDELYLEGSKL